MVLVLVLSPHVYPVIRVSIYICTGVVAYVGYIPHFWNKVGRDLYRFWSEVGIVCINEGHLHGGPLVIRNSFIAILLLKN